MTAQDYPVTFPYGATTAPYTKAHPHRGDDRPCPELTPIVIGGVTIGLTGATGYVFGPHLHIQEWSGNYANVRKPQNAFKGGTVINIDSDGTQGDGSFGKFISIQNADGWVDSYCHLGEINVNVGLKVTEEEEVIIEKTDDWYARMNRLHHQLVRNGDLPVDFFNKIVGRDVWDIVKSWSDHPEADLLIQYQLEGEQSRRDNWPGQIYKLQDSLKATTDKLNQVASQADLSTKLQKQVDDLTAKNKELTDQKLADEEAGKGFFRAIARLLGLVK